jgi:hypothetical protein
MRSLLFLCVALLAACASNDQTRVTGAVATPLNDLNLVSAPIPDTLARAQRAPYGAPSDSSCAGLAAEVHALDADLGPDLDVPASDSNPSLIERGGSAVVGAVQKTAEGVIPFRGWVRKLTGAERYSRQVAAAIAAGTVRRAYLKGMAQAKGC